MIKIDQALVDTILSGNLALDVVHENGSYSQWTTVYTTKSGVYTPIADRPFLEIKNFPAGSSPLSLAHSNDVVGLYQVIVRYPVDTGAITAKNKTEAVLALFKVGSTITYSTQNIHIESNARDGGRVNEGFYEIVVRINYRAFVTR